MENILNEVKVKLKKSFYIFEKGDIINMKYNPDIGIFIYCDDGYFEHKLKKEDVEIIDDFI